MGRNTAEKYNKPDSLAEPDTARRTNGEYVWMMDGGNCETPCGIGEQINTTRRKGRGRRAINTEVVPFKFRLIRSGTRPINDQQK